MKAFNSIFLLLACASVASSIHASAPTASSTSSSSIENTSDEIELVAADIIAEYFITGKRDRLAKQACEAKIRASRDVYMQKRALYAKAIAKKYPSEELTWKDVGTCVYTEIEERVRQEDRRLMQEIDGEEMDEDCLDNLLFPVRKKLDNDLITYKKFIEKHPTTTIREYLDSDACKVQ